jgi:hypothetical protein
MIPNKGNIGTYIADSDGFWSGKRAWLAGCVSKAWGHVIRKLANRRQRFFAGILANAARSASEYPCGEIY